MGKSGSSSQANQTTTTNNVDRRLVNESGIVAAEGSIVNAEFIDAGAVKAAFDFATNSDAINGAGFNKLLDVAEKLTTKTQDNATTLSSRFQDNVMDAFERAKTTANGSIDQKTMIILGVTAAAALALMNRKGG
jgi:hypothetical protein